ncbi:hypothetical protein GGX14DRAFT_635927 [Mycena pura]|uniref:Uncharacterized protein n=1 Tax=Mycena pura TaxID=153505 RepID=A0AAD6VA48_9AGAR|nr:hypothetical protein GGX14DRAFT_635927 [Mycena pura]
MFVAFDLRKRHNPAGLRDRKPLASSESRRGSVSPLSNHAPGGHRRALRDQRTIHHDVEPTNTSITTDRNFVLRDFWVKRFRTVTTRPRCIAHHGAPRGWRNRQAELAVDGLDRVREIGRIFRNEGIDLTHNSDFIYM